MTLRKNILGEKPLYSTCELLNHINIEKEDMNKWENTINMLNL
jgi:hypothetical protein